MKQVTRPDIELLARHSDWRRADIRQTLEREVYAGPADWLRFGRYLLLGAGTAFLLSGLVFFFAYNWAGLHRSIKVGTVLALFLATGLGGLFAPLREGVRRVVLTAAVALIGVLLAVLGQVYQTGANNYDFFLAWTVFALPWVVLLPFAPLWLLFAGLVNASFFTYSQQIGIELSFVATGLLLFVLNVAGWLVTWLLFRGRASFRWFIQLLALWAAVIVTVNVSSDTLYRYDGAPGQLALTLGLAGLVYAGWTVIAFRERSVFYPAVAGGSILVSLVFLLLRVSDSLGGFFLAGILLLSGVTFLAHALNRLNHRWDGA